MVGLTYAISLVLYNPKGGCNLKNLEEIIETAVKRFNAKNEYRKKVLIKDIDDMKLMVHYTLYCENQQEADSSKKPNATDLQFISKALEPYGSQISNTAGRIFRTGFCKQISSDSEVSFDC